ncbi:hypothetical protein A2914_02970 [Candidatus Nomurabacteria bacterium RIFCSPLOWO2_01_FULL_41_21]|uniref:DUF5671 domain-containing protein n=2 Tax=Candidatus Nomuraibacteriota TaxID=1752729 RepID=A0A1F6V3U4_9BACT|nr:MAG: hypothetical protein A2733_01865 [Candidatus Nomurabacteria bacterium RIFCSPHIGHO2_01_FULL_40_20]OGI88106.1 MAG: hypothetical protein A2914_02970 [Candidatus Nomurabacteria bacterium RIFCSPLOWO2_01_FULL_41_21]
METQQNLQTNVPKLNLSFFFLSLGVIITLITSVVSFLNLFFATLDKKFPDVLNATYQYGYSTYDFESMRMALATLIIFFPVFLVISYFWKKHMEQGLGHIDEIIRKWLIYIVLFLSSLVIVIDLVTLVKYFVAGEITNRFIFKVLATLVVAIFVGVYYMFELKGRKKIFGFSVPLWGAIKSSILVALVISFAFCVMGSPFKQRSLRLDERRVQDLQNIQWQVISFYQQKEKLPENLNELKNPISGSYIPVEPEFEKGKVYEYKVINAKKLTFELCADFALPMPKGWQEYNYGKGGIMPMMGYSERDMVVSYPYPWPGPGGVNESWDHEAGRTCFERTIDPELYPPYPDPITDTISIENPAKY